MHWKHAGAGLLALGTVVTGTASAEAAQGCGPGFHRGVYGYCRPNLYRPFGFYRPYGVYRPAYFGPRRWGWGPGWRRPGWGGAGWHRAGWGGPRRGWGGPGWHHRW